MNKQQVATILTMAAAVDDRIDPDNPRVVMWTECLHPEMDIEWAKKYVVKHYAEAKTILMPADLNQAWKAEFARRRSEAVWAELDAIGRDAVPPPAEVVEFATRRNLAIDNLPAN